SSQQIPRICRRWPVGGRCMSESSDAPSATGGRSPSRPLIRFFGYVRPHAWLIAGGSAMGIGKFVLPLLFPLVFKYVVDVLLVPQPRLESVNLTLDRSSIALAKLM